MYEGGRHAGFHKEAPANVLWSDYSYIQTVDPMDVRPMKGFCAGLFFFCIGFFPLGGIFLFLGSVVEKSFPEFNGDIFIALAGICIPFGVVALLLFSYTLKWVMIRKIGSRGEVLFEPGGDCYFVGIEDAFTFDKRKLVADDFGLMKISPGLVQLEMINHSAQFRIEDLKVSLLYVGHNNAGVRLSVAGGDYPWSVVLSPVGNFSLLTEIDAVKKSKALIEKLVEAGAVMEVERASDIRLTKQQELEVIMEGAELVDDEVYEGEFGMEAGNDDLMDKRYQEVKVEIDKKQEQKKRGWMKNIGILIITLLLFMQLGKMKWGGEFVVLVLVVILVHEMGHFLGMKIFGYRDIQMFFIPLMGAAVAGRGQNVAGWKKAVVSLLGPLPGIGLSMVMFIVYLVTRQEIYSKLGLIFLVVNVFNLLPIFPLDGGRFLQQVLFSRNRFFELAMNAITGIALLLLGYAIGSWFLKILGFLNLFTIHFKYKLSKAAKHFKEELEARGGYEDQIYAGGSGDEIPENFLKRMIGWIYKNMPGPMKAKTAATTALELWERIRIKPPGVGATLGLLVVFGMGYVVAFVSLGMFAAGHIDELRYMTRIVQYEDEQGVTRYKEVAYSMGKLSQEVELSDDKEYYHGSHTGYYFEGEVSERGQWDMGRKVGQWNWYEPNSLMYEECRYEKGKPVYGRYLEDGDWTEYSWEDYPPAEQEYYEREAEFQYGPGKKPEIEPFIVYDPNGILEPNDVEAEVERVNVNE